MHLYLNAFSLHVYFLFSFVCILFIVAVIDVVIVVVILVMFLPIFFLQVVYRKVNTELLCDDLNLKKVVTDILLKVVLGNKEQEALTYNVQLLQTDYLFVTIIIVST